MAPRTYPWTNSGIAAPATIRKASRSRAEDSWRTATVGGLLGTCGASTAQSSFAACVHSIAFDRTVGGNREVSWVAALDAQREVELAAAGSDRARSAGSLFPVCSRKRKDALERASELRLYGGRYWF